MYRFTNRESNWRTHLHWTSFVERRHNNLPGSGLDCIFRILYFHRIFQGLQSSLIYYLFVPFQVFSLTVCLGLFHGLVLFPVMFTLAGPTNTEEPHSDTKGTDDPDSDTKDKDEPDTEISKTNHSKRQLAGHSNEGFH